MNLPEKLFAIEEIKQLKGRYFRSVDTKNAELLRSVFTDDAVLDFRGAATDPANNLNAAPAASNEVLHGPDEATNAIMEAVSPLVSCHHGSIPEIEIHNENNATGIWPMVDRLWFKSGESVKSLVGYGHYIETYRRVNGQWKIAKLRLERLRVEVETS